MDLRKILFKYRSFTPVPFLVGMIFFAKPFLLSIVSGFPVLLIGEFIRFWGVSFAGSETRTTNGVGSSRLVTGGPFAYIRNPLYVGNMLIYLGVGIMSWAGFPLFPLLTLLYFVFQYAMIVSLEEEHLEQTYGAEYQNYKKDVPKFFPSFKKTDRKTGPGTIANWKTGIKSESRTLQSIAIVVAIIFVVWILKSGAN
jgi:protein-S-isoprenylcysteine O-methyltransferase Ste14